MNAIFVKPFNAAEVKTALFQMAPSKASGVDGFTEVFFQPLVPCGEGSSDGGVGLSERG